MTTLERLQAWYSRQCDGTWEHSSGIIIETCDNPGWWVKVDLAGTDLFGRKFSGIAEGVDRNNFALGPRWLSCRIEGETWHGAGDETQLERILQCLLEWAEDVPK